MVGFKNTTATDSYTRMAGQRGQLRQSRRSSRRGEILRVRHRLPRPRALVPLPSRMYVFADLGRRPSCKVHRTEY